MLRIDAATGWSLGLWFVLGFVPTVGESMGWQALLSHQGIAAWAQAIGTVLAVVGATYATRMQIDATASAERERQRRIGAGAIMQIRHVLELAIELGKHLHTAEDAAHFIKTHYRRDEYEAALREMNEVVRPILHEPFLAIGARWLDIHLWRVMKQVNLIEDRGLEHPSFEAECQKARDLFDPIWTWDQSCLTPAMDRFHDELT